MRIRSIVRRITDNDYVFTIFTKIMAVLIGLIASSFSNRFLGPELKGQLGQISSMISISLLYMSSAMPGYWEMTLFSWKGSTVRS